MDKKIINEINRISDLLGVKSLISEQPIPKFIKAIAGYSDDIIKQIYKSTNSVGDDILRKVRKGESLGDEATEIFLRNLDLRKMAAMAIDSGEMGSTYISTLNDIAEKIKKNPKGMESVLKQVDDAIEKIGFLSDAPEEFIDAIKLESRERITKKVKINGVVDDVDMSEIINLISNKASKVTNIDNFKSQLSEFLVENKKRLSPMFTSRDITRYVDEISGQLEVILSKSKNSKQFKSVENLWSKLPPSEQEKLAIKSIENMTKELPLNLKNIISNPRKLVDRIVKGSNGKFEWSVFWTNIKGIYYKAIFFQVLREMWKVTTTRADQKSGKEIGYDGWVESLLDGRSYEEFIAGLVIPPVEWMASIISWADRDATYDDIREMLPPSYRDNFFRDDSGDMYIKKAGVNYLVYIKDNFVAIEINGKPYKLEDIEF